MRPFSRPILRCRDKDLRLAVTVHEVRTVRRYGKEDEGNNQSSSRDRRRRSTGDPMLAKRASDDMVAIKASIETVGQLAPVELIVVVVADRHSGRAFEYRALNGDGSGPAGIAKDRPCAHRCSRGYPAQGRRVRHADDNMP
jgi:hypothetical protein